MSERPILFNGEMVRAILDGRKTQTRRVVKPQPIQPCDGAYFDKYNKGPQWNWWTKDNKQCLDQIIKCPFGKPGDRLWVRETWGINHLEHGWSKQVSKLNPKDLEGYILYRADGDWEDQFEQTDGDCPPWRPSIHMPRWASRITLEIKNVRVERLQDISEGDAKAEGCSKSCYPEEYESDHETGYFSPKSYGSDFNYIWDSVYGKESWEANPWVWVVEFQHLKHQFPDTINEMARGNNPKPKDQPSNSDLKYEKVRKARMK